MLGLAAAAAVVIYLALANKGTTNYNTDAGVQGELKAMAASNPQGYAAITQMMNTQANPALIAQYALQLATPYPNISKMLLAKFDQTVTKVTGNSSTQWNTWSTGTTPGTDVTPVDVLLGAMPVLSYQQTGSDPKARVLLGVAQGVDSATVARARADFSV